MASLLDLAQARLGGLLAPQRPSMAGLLGGQRTQGNLASALQGYTPPQMTAMTNPQVMDYARNVAQTAQQNLQTQMSDLDKALVMDQQGIQVGDREALARLMEQVPGLMGATAYHGTPHNIRGQFDISKVGTGEGAQAYGHGMYFAESPSVAETYKRAGGGLEIKYGKPLEEIGINPEVTMRSMDFDANPLNQGLGRIVKSLRTTALDYPDVPVNQSLVKEHFDEYIRLLDDKYPKDAAQKKALQDLVAKEGYPDINFGGNLYKVDIPDEYIPTMMDYDKPLGQQNEVVKKALNKIKKQITPEMKDELGGDLNLLFGKDVTPVQFLNTMEIIHPTGGVGIGEKMLNDLGVKGMRYKDAMSRGVDKGTSNFVVFDPTDVKILEKNSQKVEGLLD
jgi:hypothetical protein